MSDLPHHLHSDDPAAADPARRRLQKSPFLRLPSLPSRLSHRLSPPLLPPIVDHSTDDILIDDAHLPLPDHDMNVYRWAVLYENQRGITIFSTPFYSPLSLLPSDPQPFTIPHNHNPPAHHPNLSLDNYPLPDGTWRWVSTAWMIDMRSDLGEVQHDGFEYNWSFRRDHWRAKIGKLSTGAWVRRRRWVRLMMRPAIYPHSPSANHTPISPSNLSSVDLDYNASYTWVGSEQDWHHVHRLLRQLGRDGRKLELWRTWLGPYAQVHASDTKRNSTRPSQDTPEKHLSDVVPAGNPPSLPHLTAIMNNHGEAILHSLVFPDSRAQFIDLARRASLEGCLGRAFSSADVDFWSYADDLDKLYVSIATV